MSSGDRVAVLIDCDNISHQLCEAIFEETSRHGTLGIKRAWMSHLWVRLRSGRQPAKKAKKS